MADAVPLRQPRPGQELIEERETPYNYIQIAREGGMVKMEVDQGWFTYSKYRPGELRTFSYRDYFPLAVLVSGAEDFPRSVCILGLASGADARVIRSAFPGAHITGVEIDPEIIELGAEHMGLENARVDRTVIADGRAFLRADPRSYDLIIVDVYNQAYIPFHMATREFFELASRRLAPGGVIAMNVAWRSRDEWKLPRTIANTLKEVFPSVYVQMFARKTNTLLYAANRKVEPEEVRAAMRNPGNEYVRELLDEELAVFRPHQGEGEVFTDDRAPVELYTDFTIDSFFNMRND